jgi:hypothetical protein
MPHDSALYDTVTGHNSPAQTKAAELAQIEDTRQKHKSDDVNTVVQFRTLTGQNTPAPTLATLTPNTKVTPTDEFDVVLTGTNFQQWSQVIWNGAIRPTTYTSPTSLTVRAPAVVSAGAVPVRVTSGGELTSGAVNFTFT